MIRVVVLPLFCLTFGSCSVDYEENTVDLSTDMQASKQHIYLAAPSIHEEYYTDAFENIIDFHTDLPKAIAQHDEVSVIVDADTKNYFSDKLEEELLIEADVYDIWMRDFGLTGFGTTKVVYLPDYLEEGHSISIDRSVERFLEDQEISYTSSKLILDGGNIVDNGYGQAVITERVYSDNPHLAHDEIRTQLIKDLDLTHLTIIPEEEGDTTGHSDGMVTFLEEKILLVNEFDEPLRSHVLSALDDGLSDGVEIIEVPNYNKISEWRDFSSACGGYVNALVTEQAVYMPVFGLSSDEEIVELFQWHTSKPVIPIDASKVCHMGGSVRCLSMQVR